MIVLTIIILLVFMIPVLTTILHAAITEIQHEALDRYSMIFDSLCLLGIVLTVIFNVFDSQFIGFFSAFLVSKNIAKFVLRLRIG